MSKLNIFNIQKFCLHDGPGIRTTVFVKGCPLRCVWCHNPESGRSPMQLMYYRSKCTGCKRCIGICDARRIDLDDDRFVIVDHDLCSACGKCVSACLNNANEICGREEGTDKILENVLADRIFYGNTGGMTVSGGEPAMQPKGVLDLIGSAEREGINTVIETSGYGEAEFFKTACNLGVTFYYDLKAIDGDKHKKCTGVLNELILSNLKMLFDMNADIVLRVPLVPGINDDEKDLELLGRFLSEHESEYNHAEIMKYHNLGSSKAEALGVFYGAPKESTDKARANEWIDALNRYGVKRVIVSQ